jgi:hypothetical protein
MLYWTEGLDGSSGDIKPGQQAVISGNFDS